MAPKKKPTTQTSASTKSIADLKALSAAELHTELQAARRDLYILTMKKEL